MVILDDVIVSQINKKRSLGYSKPEVSLSSNKLHRYTVHQKYPAL